MSNLPEVFRHGPPISGRVIRLDISTTGAAFVIPSGWRGEYCEWRVYTDDVTTGVAAVDVLFGDSTVSVTYDTDSTVNTGAITVNAASGARIVSNGPPRYWHFPADPAITHFAVDAVGNGHLEITRRS